MQSSVDRFQFRKKPKKQKQGRGRLGVCLGVRWKTCSDPSTPRPGAPNTGAKEMSGALRSE